MRGFGFLVATLCAVILFMAGIAALVYALSSPIPPKEIIQGKITHKEIVSSVKPVYTDYVLTVNQKEVDVSQDTYDMASVGEVVKVSYQNGRLESVKVAS